MAAKNKGTPQPKALATAPQAAPNDQIAINRTVKAIAPETLPAVPLRFVPSTSDVRRRTLRLVAEDQRSELLDALKELQGAGAKLTTDLGEFAPNTAVVPEIMGRIVAAEGVLQRLRSLVTCHEELEDIALSDALVLLEQAYGEYEHRVSHIPALANRYPKLARFFAQRSQAIVEGHARRRAVKVNPEG